MKNWEPPVGYTEKKYNYVYKLTFKYDNRYYYYGVHSTNINPEEDDYYGSGANVKKLKSLYGKDCFNKEILEFFGTRKEALLAEDSLVPITILSDKFCLNRIQGGGTFDTTGIVMDEDFRKNVSERFLGKPRSPEAIAKMIEARRRRGTDKHSKEAREKMSKNKKNLIPVVKGESYIWINKEELDQYLSQGWQHGFTKCRNQKVAESKMGDKNPMFGKHWTEEAKAKMIKTKIENGTNFHSEEVKKILAEKNREKAKNPEFRKKLSESIKGKNTWSKGRRRIHKNGVTKSVVQEEVQKYLKNGWQLGQGYKVSNGR